MDTSAVKSSLGHSNARFYRGPSSLEASMSSNIIWGSPNFDRIQGTDGDDIIYAGGGDDVIHGRAGADTIHGGTGWDTMYGGDGNDVFFASQTSSPFYGSFEGNDSLFYWEGDILFGESGYDTVFSSASFIANYYADPGVWPQVPELVNTGIEKVILTGVDNIDVMNFHDQSPAPTSIVGNDGDNNLSGINDGGTIHGNGGDDIISGSRNVDTLYGGTGDDSLQGAGGADILFGGDGRDSLDGGGGKDILVGGDGADAFIFGRSSQDYSLDSKQADRIVDFNIDEDMIHFDNGIFTALGETIGALDETMFASNIDGVATSSDQRILYDNDDGRLYYDPDGSGGFGRYLIANLDNGPNLLAENLYVI